MASLYKSKVDRMVGLSNRSKRYCNYIAATLWDRLTVAVLKLPRRKQSESYCILQRIGCQRELNVKLTATLWQTARKQT